MPLALVELEGKKSNWWLHPDNGKEGLFKNVKPLHLIWHYTIRDKFISQILRKYCNEPFYIKMSYPLNRIFSQVLLISQKRLDNSLCHTAPKIAYWLPGNAIRLNQSPQLLLDEAFQEASHDVCHDMLSCAFLLLWHGGRGSGGLIICRFISLTFSAGLISTSQEICDFFASHSQIRPILKIQHIPSVLFNSSALGHSCRRRNRAMIGQIIIRFRIKPVSTKHTLQCVSCSVCSSVLYR